MRKLLKLRAVLSVVSRSVATFPGGGQLLTRTSLLIGRFSPTTAARMLRSNTDPRLNIIDAVADLLFTHGHPGAEALRIGLARAQSPSAAHTLGRLGERYARAGMIEEALQSLQNAVKKLPDSAELHMALGRTLKYAQREGIVRDPILGLVQGRLPQTEQALEAFRAAEVRVPENPWVKFEVGALYIENGRIEEGLDYLQRAVTVSPKPAWLRHLASYYRQPHIADFEKSLKLYEQAFAGNPRDHRALGGVVSVGGRWSLNWPRLWSSALRARIGPEWAPEFQQVWELGTGPAHGQKRQQWEDEILTAIAQAQVGRPLRKEIAELLTLRLQFSGHLQLGFQLRKQMASHTQTLIGGGLRLDRAQRLRRLISALAYTDNYWEALRVLESPPLERTPLVEEQLQKLRADINVLQGDTYPLRNFAQKQQRDHPIHGEDRMRELVRDKRVAIVGPADGGGDFGHTIDSHDIVVRTRFRPQVLKGNENRLGSRTDIAYLNGLDLPVFAPEIDRAVEAGKLQLVVARQLSFVAHQQNDFDWVRYSRSEFALHFHGVPLAIPRVLYDLLQFAPAEIGLFNIDMYAGATSFMAGYRPGENGFRPRSALNDVLVVHDLLTDFKFLSTLAHTHEVRAYGIADEILSLSGEEYLDRLEKSGSLRMAENFRS